ncbi:chemotaxis protein CheA [Sphingobium sp. SYK-6]|uniref:chemotaxis protein CheA n=1 Tax=Sphingobium sp. (strain NBRC 103272 / SYK-6) TaxID=627192 RepID=UPI00022774CD|nr:chemotaxis protein CheA [Sphingobium sp. SYK-6]BAK66069.1 chemotaxis protein CheA [Sphingobium sp. SYK-6]
MDDLLVQFLIEGRDLVGQAHGDLRALSADMADARAFDSLFRATHTLKGSVALFDMAPAEALLHAAETLLDRARRTGVALTARQMEALVAVIDQVDRWIDAMEAQGALSDDAPAIAAQLVAALAEDGSAQAARAPQPKAPQPGAMTAFRFTPDPECFFRGEDPLATLAAVPGLLSLEMLPAEPWPPLDLLDPFRCMVRFEGTSSASADAVRAAFRLVPDQIEIEAAQEAKPDTGPDPDDGIAVTAGSGESVLRVDGARLDRLATQTGELVVAVHALQALASEIAARDPALGMAFRRAQAGIERASTALRQSVADVRLVSLQPILRRLPRLARELGATLGKPLHFTLTGDDTRVDKQIADGLFEPLLHLVRNAIDHGLETPEERAAAGKPAQGQVTLAIAARGERLVISLTDDGRGISADQIRAGAVARGLIDAADAADLTDMQAIRLIFARGFSTAAHVTDVSGRGVGMDAVSAAVERLHGTIEIESAVGTGTAIRLLLPLAAITTRLLTIHAGGERYAVPFDQVAETVRLPASGIQQLGRGEACVIRDRTVPVVDLGEALGGGREESGHARLIVSQAAGEPVAFRVAAFGERLDAVVSERRGLIARLPAVIGTSLLADGTVLLVLDLAELAA